MIKVQEILQTIDGAIGGSEWFVFLLLGVGVFFTIYLGFPQIRYFQHALRIVSGKYDKKGDQGDTSHFQALTTALSGTVGTGNIAGVALAIHLGGPGALFWMLITALLGMCTKFVEVTLSHKYREFGEDGTVSGGPMYFMKKRLNIKTSSGKMIKTGYWMGGFFAVATVISSFGTGNLPQINGISNSLFSTFGINKVLTGLVLSVLLGLVIIGGIKRIAKVTSRLVPAMALIYFIGALAVLITNYNNILPSLASVFTDVFTGSAATGGFLGAGFIFAFNRGVNRGLFSNEAGQGSAPIAHSAARAHEPVSEGFVAILEPFIDTVIICTLTGVVLLSSGVWNEKLDQKFQYSDIEILDGYYDETSPKDKEALYLHLQNKEQLKEFNGKLDIKDGEISNIITFLHARSVADQVTVLKAGETFTGSIQIVDGNMPSDTDLEFHGKSLMHSAPLTAVAFSRGLFGSFGQYIVSIGLLLFAFSTAISWSYYGDRAMTYLVGSKGVIWYRIVYVVSFFIAAFVDTTLVWILSGITIAFMTIPNLVSIFLLHREMKNTVKDYWKTFTKEHPKSKIPRGVLKN